MTLDFVTVFDRHYEAQGLTMLRSLLRNSRDIRVWVVAGDRQVEMSVEALKDERLRIVPLKDLETDDLLAVKGSRSRGEYYWTITPFLPSYVFRSQPDAFVVTYVDADMYFYDDPYRLLDEFLGDDKAAVMVTPHDYSSRYDQSEVSGIFCVQFLPFRRDASKEILRTWQSQCLEWCFGRPEPGRFGDQKYLDSWPADYGPAVRIQENLLILGAPWNLEDRDPAVLVAYHFHGFRPLSRRLVAGHLGYRLPKAKRRVVYSQYVCDVSHELCRAGGIATFRALDAARPWYKTLARVGITVLRRGPRSVGLSRLHGCEGPPSNESAD